MVSGLFSQLSMTTRQLIVLLAVIGLLVLLLPCVGSLILLREWSFYNFQPRPT